MTVSRALIRGGQGGGRKRNYSQNARGRIVMKESSREREEERNGKTGVW